ncbi:hypothetical protein A9Q83_15965 [Alphaproteobacteria bacterium 46_93_T64]|nr:hypothetical protein A9Q83_15965 [Alphaproteobacteria bacterium 46_93_T64]
MNLSQDLARKLSLKSRYWQRMQREKVMQRQTIQNHSREYADIINQKKSMAKQLGKIHNMRRH